MMHFNMIANFSFGGSSTKVPTVIVRLARGNLKGFSLVLWIENVATEQCCSKSGVQII
jgi:hypothetical protein